VSEVSVVTGPPVTKSTRLGLVLGSVVLLSVAVAGCLGSSKQATFYILEPRPQQLLAESPGNAIGLVVGPLRLPAFLDRQQLVTRVRGSEIRIHEFDRWGGTFRSEILRALVGNIGALLETERIVPYPISPPWNAGYRLVLNVERLDGELGRELALDVLWSVVPYAGGESLVYHRTVLRRELTSSSVQALVEAYDELLSQMSAEIARALIEVEAASETSPSS
jgi:uncharacterized lipoprotein YmbA